MASLHCKFVKFGQIWVMVDPGNLEEIGKNLPKNWKKIRKCGLKNEPKAKILPVNFQKTGRFETAGAAQPIELSKKRRHF